MSLTVAIYLEFALGTFRLDYCNSLYSLAYYRWHCMTAMLNDQIHQMLSLYLSSSCIGCHNVMHYSKYWTTTNNGTHGSTRSQACTSTGLDWIEQCFTSTPTQYRLYERRYLQVKRPNQQYQSTEGRKLQRKIQKKQKKITKYT